MLSEYLSDQNLAVYHHIDQINHEFGPQQSYCNLKPSEKLFRLTRSNHWGQQQLMGGLPVSDYSWTGFEFLLKINSMFWQVFLTNVQWWVLGHCNTAFIFLIKNANCWGTPSKNGIHRISDWLGAGYNFAKWIIRNQGTASHSCGMLQKYNTFPLRYGPEVLTNGFHSYSPLEMAKAEGHLETVIDTPIQKNWPSELLQMINIWWWIIINT